MLDVYDSDGTGERGGSDAESRRPWLMIYFRCCHVYSRAYRNANATHYVGRCPRCAGEVMARIGEGGTARRMFTAE